jgi:hypothetical protein
MSKFRKKPVVIEAFQITKETRQDNSEWPEWLHLAWNLSFDTMGMVGHEDFPHSNGKDRLIIRTLEGVMTVGWNDWIIRGEQGELYACKPDVFVLTYEPVEL